MTNVTDKHRKALGKGLSALLPSRPPSPTPPPLAQPQPTEAGLHAPISHIDPNPLQPRSHFHAGHLEELAQSIRVNGIIQPLAVRRRGERFELLAGERRLRAAKLAGLTEVPVVVQDVGDDHLLEIALIENLQREDLNPMEAARAFDRLHHELGLTQEEIGRRTGKDRASIANMLRLLRLPDEVQILLEESRLSMGQARAILGLPTPESQIQLAEKASAQGLSTRQVERLVRQLSGDAPKRPSKKDAKQDPNLRAAIDELERALSTRVRIVELNEQRGRIEIDYYSPDDLDRLYHVIVKEDRT